MRQNFMRWSVLLLCIVASCSNGIVNEPYDDADIRARTYQSLYSELRLDTLGYDIMAVAEGDSLERGFFWPASFQRHPDALFDALAAMLPIRIVGMDEVVSVNEASTNPPYVTRDTDEAVIPVFTNGIGRRDETHLTVICGVHLPHVLSAYGACNLAYADGNWQVTDIQFYYLRESL
ncbi:MAG: hypothetical protein KFH87_00530 [Bacteroidetes bacterium]|nr:hypothetical protein [Bacteroidota bacterium]